MPFRESPPGVLDFAMQIQESIGEMRQMLGRVEGRLDAIDTHLGTLAGKCSHHSSLIHQLAQKQAIADWLGSWKAKVAIPLIAALIGAGGAIAGVIMAR